MTSVVSRGDKHPFKGRGEKCMQVMMNRSADTFRCHESADMPIHAVAEAPSFADQLAASIPADTRAELDAAEQLRTRHWLAQLAAASGHGAEDPFTGRQEAAARRLVEGAAADTLRTVAALLRALSDD